MVNFLLAITLLCALGLGFGACAAWLPTWIGAPALIGAIVLLLVIDRRLTRKSILALLLIAAVLWPGALLAGESCCTLPGCPGPATCDCPAGCSSDCCQPKPARPARYVNARPRFFRIVFARRR
jgi:hypothetical protein